MSLIDQSIAAGQGTFDSIAASLPFLNHPKPPPVSKGPDFPTGFFIQEYVNSKPDPNRKIIQLAGNMMPMEPFPWQLEQRVQRDYYPGNPEPVLQIMGAKEDDLVIRGRFKDKKYQDTSLYGVSYQMSLLLDAVCKRGNIIQFGFNGVAGRWVRFGMLQKNDWKMKKLSWIDYEMTFIISGPTLPKNNFFAAPDKSVPDTVNQQLIAAATAFQQQTVPPFTMPQSISGFINGLTNQIAGYVTQVTNFVSTVISTAADIEASANRALGLIKNLKSFLASSRNQIGALGFGYNNLSSQVSPAPQFTDAQTNIAFLTEIMAQIAQLSLFASQLKAQIISISATTPDTQYKVQQGDTLQRIAIKVYGAMDNWDLIYTHNKLTSTVLNPGQILEIPKL